MMGGVRVSSTVGGVLTRYVVDKNRDFAQVLEEVDGLGALVVRYVHGDDLISQSRAGTTSYYHYDGLGSTRALSNDTGGTTDTYTYDAFGNLIVLGRHYTQRLSLHRRATRSQHRFLLSEGSVL